VILIYISQIHLLPYETSSRTNNKYFPSRTDCPAHFTLLDLKSINAHILASDSGVLKYNVLKTPSSW
jgi:hypothetical protein